MEPSNNTETDEETIAMKRKRARRVSFADNEITSVHIFRRDDDQTSSSSDAHPDSVLGLFRDLAGDSDDFDDNRPQNPIDEDGEAVDRTNSFLQPIGSPSPGGSSTTAAEDTDGDDFHGPVSADFIRPERLSDSGVSDDITMDSTAFSMHYRSIARSDSGDLKTPTRFGASTSTCRSSGSSGSYMELTHLEKKALQVAAVVASGGGDSDNMSIEGEGPKSCDFGELSPRLVAILAQGSDDLHAISPLGSKATRSPVTIPIHQITHDTTVAAASESSTKNTAELVNDATVPARKQLEFAKGTPPKMDEGDQLALAAKYVLDFNKGQVKESNSKDKGQVSNSSHKSDQVGNPVHGFMPLSLSAKKLVFMGSTDSPRSTGNISPALKQSGLFGPEGHVTPSATLSSIPKSISKLKTLENTPTSTFKEDIDKLKCRLSKYSPGISFLSEKDCEYKQVETLTAPLEERLFSLTPKNNMHQGLINTDEHRIDSLRSIGKLRQNEETVATKKDEEKINMISVDVSYNDGNPKPVEIVASPLSKTHISRVIDFDLADSTVEKIKDQVLATMHAKPFSSPEKSLDKNLPLSVECQSNCHGELKQLDRQNESVNSGLRQAIEYNTQTVANKLELSGFVNGEQPSSPFEAAQINEFAKSASKGKSAQSPSNRFLVPRSPSQEATTLLPSLQESPNELLNSNIQNLSHKGNSDGHVNLGNTFQPLLQVAQSPLTKSGIEVSSGKKRKGVEILSDGDNIGYMRSESEKFEDQKWNDWDQILKKFSTSTKQLLSLSVDRLNLRLIGTLEDILVHLQKFEKWDILSSEIHSQKSTDHLNVPRHKRGVEMRMLLFNIAYEKAKQQLMNIKRERLLKKVQQLSSGLQETQLMKNSIIFSPKSGSIDIQADDSHIHTRLFNSRGTCQVSCKKVMEKRKEIESLDHKVKSLSEFLYNHCKMEGDQSSTNIINSVPHYLQKKMSYKLIFQNLKLWDVEGYESKDDYYKISLNYYDYIIQRFTVKAGLSSIIMSRSLNDVNIRKTYPNMDAFSAFVYVLNTQTTKKCTGPTSMAQETQGILYTLSSIINYRDGGSKLLLKIYSMWSRKYKLMITSSLLSNLLDVVEEVQLALIEIRNLIQAKFYSPSVHELDLQLSFIDFYSGKKVQVTLDMTCLKCGAYPVEVLPSQIYDPAASREQKALPSSLVDEIRTAAESVKVGYSRIIRLCRCISQAVLACTQNR